MQCHECGEHISDKAADCPHCGASVGSPPEGTNRGPADPAGAGRDGTDDETTPEPTGAARDERGSAGDGSTVDESGDVDESADDEPMGGDRTDPASYGATDGQASETGGPAPDEDQPAGTDGESSRGQAPPGQGQSDTGGQVDETPPSTGGQNQPSTGGQSHQSTGGQNHPPTGGQSGGAPPAAGGQDQPAAGAQGQPTTGGQGQAPGGGQGQAPAGGQAPAPAGEQGQPTAASQGQPAASGHGQPSPAGQGQGSAGGRGGQQATQQGPPGRHPSGEGGFDAEAFLKRLPLFPGAAAGFATGVILFTVAVAYAAVVPDAFSSTLELGALVLLDLQFATSGHVTPALFGMFEVVSPADAAVGFLYLLPPLGLFTAAKLAVAFNADEETTLPESAAGGATIVLGYFPVMLVTYFLSGSEGFVTASLVTTFNAGVVYPAIFGVIGGLAGGVYSGSERRVGTVYALGALFVIAIGTFLASFVAVLSVPVSPGILTHVFLALFSFVAANAFVFSGGESAAILALFVVGLTVFAASFVRVWRADNESPLRGVAKGLTMAPTYFVVLGLLATTVPWFADSYVQGAIDMDFLAASFADTLRFASLSGIGEYVLTVLLGTLAFPVFLGGAAGGVATLLRSEIRDE